MAKQPEIKKSSIKNGIKLYFHCKHCLSIDEKDKVACGWTQKGFQVWCENCNSNIVAIDFEGKKVKTDNNP